MTQEQSPFFDALDKKIGVRWALLIVMCAPVAPLLPFVIGCLCLNRLSPVDCEELLAVANGAERLELVPLIFKSRGRPTRWAMGRLRSRLVIAAQRKAEAVALRRVLGGEGEVRHRVM